MLASEHQETGEEDLTHSPLPRYHAKHGERDTHSPLPYEHGENDNHSPLIYKQLLTPCVYGSRFRSQTRCCCACSSTSRTRSRN